MQEKVTILLGEMGSSKDSVARELVNKHKYINCVSHTTRSMRPNEIEGRDYYFIDKEQFYDMTEKELFVEFRKYFTKGLKDGVVTNDLWLYGLSKKEIDKKGRKIIIVDIQGMLDICNYVGAENTNVIYLFCDEKVRRERALKRGDLAEEVERRIKSEKGFQKEALRYADIVIPTDRSMDEIMKDVIEFLDMNN